ncbi:hypothetical protein [Acidipropionibacterium acidipropionici]|nr:hypothetical protein [Acidipropionibacterium acidipropionici]
MATASATLWSSAFITCTTSREDMRSRSLEAVLRCSVVLTWCVDS